MFFPIVFGIPESTPKEDVQKLRRLLVSRISVVASCHFWEVHPFFPTDLAGDPVIPQDGGDAIYISLDTEMFHGKVDAEIIATSITYTIAMEVWRILHGMYDVVCVVDDLNPKWKSFIPRAKKQ